MLRVDRGSCRSDGRFGRAADARVGAERIERSKASVCVLMISTRGTQPDISPGGAHDSRGNGKCGAIRLTRSPWPDRSLVAISGRGQNEFEC